MKNSNKRQRDIIMTSALLGFICLFAAGCAHPKIIFEKEGVSYQNYKTVYLLYGNRDQDPRSVFPMVAIKLRELGFDLTEIKPDEPYEGSQGTGFLISSEGHVLTAEHVLAKQKAATLWLDGTRVETEVVCSDKDKDLALLKPKSTLLVQAEPLPIVYQEPAKLGQEVYVIGFPLSSILGRSVRLTKGLVSSTVGLKDSPNELQVSAEIQPGSSGSPLLDKNGQVVGLMTSTLSARAMLERTGGTPQNVNFARKAQLIKAFLDTCPGPITLQKKQLDVSFDSLARSVAPVYSGIVAADFITSPKLVVDVAYTYIWDLFYRLYDFQIDFHDYGDKSLLLRVRQFRENPLDTVQATVDKSFELIKAKITAPAGKPTPAGTDAGSAVK
jgi:S1-C subfamily serine protease